MSAAVEGARAGLADYLSLVRFSHSVFALPFALIGAWTAARGVPEGRTLLLIVVCLVAARTAAMGFNRLVDREIDAANPRTRGRELPSGRISPASAGALVCGAAAVFCAAAFALSPLAGWLSFPVLALLLGYSFTKRITALAHFVLGACLGVAPMGAWIAVRGTLDGDLLPPVLLGFAVLTWVAGFDLIYACQDAEFDARRGLHSIPARFGVARALRVSRALHIATVALLIAFGLRAGLGVVWFVAVAGAAGLLVFEQRLVSPTDLSRVNAAFFTVNGWIGVGLFAAVAVDLAR